MKGDYKMCMVTKSESTAIGWLYLVTDKYVVLINSVRSGADLGDLKTIRYEHFNPEASISIIPRSDDCKIIDLEKEK